VKPLDFMIWPPLGGAGNDDVLRCAAMAAWFAGPVAASVAIPVRDLGRQPPGPLPAYVSLAALSDLHKIELISVDEARRRADARRVILLVRQRDATQDPLLAQAVPMRGSQALIGLPKAAAKPDALRYYYIGAPETDLGDAYHAVCLTYWAQGGEDPALLTASKAELLRQREHAAGFDQVALFGTGPSLGEALDRDHSQSFNIVCNTVIKNRELVQRLSPKLLVASDAHFHFSYHRYAARFLADVVEFLEAGDASFFTFDKFAAFARRRIPSVAHRIFGIPAGRTSYGYDFDRDFRVFPGDSVLNMFLLPFGSFLGDQIELNGFTGRAPTDSYFWNHSELHQYVDLMEAVRQAHPAFFHNRDFGGYAGNVDDEIALRVTAGRAAGKRLLSRTTSFYSAFAQ
jgi:hypothetical protein